MDIDNEKNLDMVSSDRQAEVKEVLEENKSEKKTSNEKVKKTKSLMPIRFKWLFLGIVLGVAFSVFAYIKIKDDINASKKVESTRLNIDYLTGTIHNMSDLITSELEYTGIVEYKTNEGKWNSFVTSEQFLMVYTAQIKAGIDLSKVKLSNVDDKIIVNIPHSVIKFKKVNPDSIRIYDVKKAWIKGDGKSQLKEAIVDAENDMEKNANLTNLLTSAEQQAETIIKGLINEVEDKEVEFNYYE